MRSGISVAFECLTSNGGLPLLGENLLGFYFDGPGRGWVFSGGRMAGYRVMLCLCGFLFVMLRSQAFRAMLEFLFVLFLICFVAHLAFYGRHSH
jgi:hypothetical protein